MRRLTRSQQGLVLRMKTAFSAQAHEFADQIDSRIALIDGRELARHMVDLNVGVSIKTPYEIKKIDHDYFDEES